MRFILDEETDDCYYLTVVVLFFCIMEFDTVDEMEGDLVKAEFEGYVAKARLLTPVFLELVNDFIARCVVVTEPAICDFFNVDTLLEA